MKAIQAKYIREQRRVEGTMKILEEIIETDYNPQQKQELVDQICKFKKAVEELGKSEPAAGGSIDAANQV